MTDTIEVAIDGRMLTFAVEYRPDQDAGAPWENSEGHGPVSDWVRRDKLPGELVLNEDRGFRRYYYFAEACRIARREGWDTPPYKDDRLTARQRAARAARADYEFLRQWCDDEWQYVGVIVTLLDDEGAPSEVTDSLWGVETYNDYHRDQARELAENLARGVGSEWDFGAKIVPQHKRDKAG